MPARHDPACSLPAGKHIKHHQFHRNECIISLCKAPGIQNRRSTFSIYYTNIQSQAHFLFFKDMGIACSPRWPGLWARATMRSMYTKLRNVPRGAHSSRAGRAGQKLCTKTRGSHPHLLLEITEYMHIIRCDQLLQENMHKFRVRKNMP